MSLDTIIHAGLRERGRPTIGLVLMGGGARTAYQVGVLRAIGAMLEARGDAPRTFPFQVLVGTSAGAINAAFLASRATQGLQAFEQLAKFWHRLRSVDVYDLNVPPWVRFSRIAVALSLSRHAQVQWRIDEQHGFARDLAQGHHAGRHRGRVALQHHRCAGRHRLELHQRRALDVLPYRQPVPNSSPGDGRGGAPSTSR